MGTIVFVDERVFVKILMDGGVEFKHVPYPFGVIFTNNHLRKEVEMANLPLPGGENAYPHQH